ncbi:hypothetical protein lerEdw1_009612 [Lerista edwardsae]|nr:hypothetical protein lerEdw1_009612 [Lerista edwardsae]
MAANRVGRRLGRASPARAAGLSPGGDRAERTPSPGIQRRQARVTVKYDRRELQRRLDTEKWIDGRLEELYRGRESEMPDEVNLDDLLEMATDGERARKLQPVWRPHPCVLSPLLATAAAASGSPNASWLPPPLLPSLAAQTAYLVPGRVGAGQQSLRASWSPATGTQRLSSKSCWRSCEASAQSTSSAGPAPPTAQGPQQLPEQA